MDKMLSCDRCPEGAPLLWEYCHHPEEPCDSGKPGIWFVDQLRAEAAAMVGDAAAGERAERERTRILCVDDDPLTLRYVRDALARVG